RKHRHLHARPHRVAEERITQQRPVILEPDKPRRLGNQRLCLVLQVGEAVIDAHQERQLRSQDQEDQGRKQRQPPTPRGRERISVLPLACGVGGSHPLAYLMAEEAICWHWESASSMFDDPAITLEKSCVHWLPTSWNCGMPT